MTKAKKIKIVGCTNKCAWYRELVGENCVFDVVLESNTSYGVNVGGVEDVFRVLKCDCEVVERVDQSPEEPTYVERSEAYLKEHGITVGTKVRVIRPWKSGEQGCTVSPASFYTRSACEDVGVVEGIGDLGNVLLNGWIVPFFVLEKVEEEVKDQYRPCETLGEIVSLVGKVVKYKGAINYTVILKYDGSLLVTCDKDLTPDELFRDYRFLDGTPVGVKL